MPSRIVAELSEHLGEELGPAGLNYLASPDFAMVVLQVQIDPALHEPTRLQLHEGLRLAGVSDRSLPDVVHRQLIAFTERADPRFTNATINLSDLLDAADTAIRVLQRQASMTEIHAYIVQGMGAPIRTSASSSRAAGCDGPCR